MAEDIGLSRLPRGAKILWERVAASRTLSLGFFFATGSRFDPPGKGGTAHLVEHLVFKGTKNHSASSLARLVDRVGGDLNAWTDREEMAFTCTVPAEAWPVALEALCELCLRPTFPAGEFDREKEVIRSEILSSLEDPEDLSYDQYLAGVCPGDWSRPVAGTEESLASINLEDARAWWSEFGAPHRLTVVVAGGADPCELVETLEQYLTSLPEVTAGPEVVPALCRPQPRRWSQKAGFQMVQVIGGFSFPPAASVREAAVRQIFSMLWGETMSSRLFQSIREERGLCYSVTSQVVEADGAAGLQFFASCAPENVGPLLDALAGELDRLFRDPPGVDEWDDGRKALLGGVILGSERTEGRVGRLWNQYQSFGQILATDATLGLLASPVTSGEAEAVISALRKDRPSLLVWGKVPRRLPSPWLA